MAYTVGQMARQMGLSASALRYYDREGLLPGVQRSAGGARQFEEADREWLEMIECLKSTGMPLRDIKKYMELCQQGDGTLDQRLQMIEGQRRAVERQMEQMRRMLDRLDYKKWYYETAKQRGEEAMKGLTLEMIPPQLRGAWLELKNQKEAEECRR